MLEPELEMLEPELEMLEPELEMPKHHYMSLIA
jgi:hypothetical protein